MSTSAVVYMTVEYRFLVYVVSTDVVVYIEGEGRFRYFDVMGVQVFSSHDM